MDATWYAFGAAALALLASVATYFIGKSASSHEHILRGCRMGAEGGRVIAQTVAREWINRPQWPLDNRANVQRWKELGRREAYAMCADRLSRAFNIETPTRTVNNS